MKFIDKQTAKSIILSKRGKIFKVIFQKRSDKSIRTMLCRTGVKKGRKGGELGYNPSSKNLIIVDEMSRDAKGRFQCESPKAIPLDSIISIS